MVDIMSPEKRSQLMSRIRGRNTTPERYISVLLTAGGLPFEQHVRDLPGTPDFVFREKQLIVFIDGDFWHGWRFPIWRHRLSNNWQDKIEKTRFRDRRNHRKLRRAGWRVVRIWEHHVESDVLHCIRRIVGYLGSPEIDWEAVESAYEDLPRLKRRNRLPKP